MSTAALAQQRAVDQTAIEVEFWNSVKDSRSAEELNAYLERYPNGNFAPLARARLRTLAGASPAPAASAAPGSGDSRAVATLRIDDLSPGTMGGLLKECVPQYRGSDNEVPELFAKNTNFTTSYAHRDSKTYYLIRSRGTQKKGACVETSAEGFAIVPIDVLAAAVEIPGADPSRRQKWYEGIQADLARTGSAIALVQFDNGNASELTFSLERHAAQVIGFKDRFMKARRFKPSAYAHVVSAPKSYSMTTMSRGNAKVVQFFRD